MIADPSRTPVIVGVGQVNDRPVTPEAGLDPVALMVSSLREADADAGTGWLPAIEALSVVDQISFRSLNPLVDAVAAGLGCNPRHRFQTAQPMGDSPIMLLNDAANRIGAGDAKIVAIVGAEALRTAAQRAAAAAGNHPSDHNPIGARTEKLPRSYRERYGLVAPVDIYPLYENATRAAWGQTLTEGQCESGAIWSLFSDVAAANPGGWIKSPKTPDQIIRPSADNRPIAFPYTKFMVANSSVNQGAGFIVASLAEARARGVPEDRLIHIGQGAAADESEDVLHRDRYDHSAGMQVSLEQTLALNGMTIDDIDFAELYSCFPCVPKMARRVLGWPVDRPASVFGGLTFGGGPIGNYMSHAVVSMVLRLRAEGTNGLLFGNGGYATHNHSIILSSHPIAAARFPSSFDMQAIADAARDPAPPIDEDYAGEGFVETYTALYDRAGAVRHGVVVARNAAGSRFLARLAAGDQAGIAFLTDGVAEPIGSRGVGVRGGDGLLDWVVTR
ncbi:MAG: Acetyl-CoA acetyltransferase [Bradyrhizobium sp.]|nr:Acetyl-CoA acetyltransferase [Bradyrhizobium sp.]